MTLCPCISFRDIPGQGIDMHARTASWDSLLPTELEEKSLLTNYWTPRSSDAVLTQQAWGDSADELLNIFFNPAVILCMKHVWTGLEAKETYR